MVNILNFRLLLKTEKNWHWDNINGKTCRRHFWWSKQVTVTCFVDKKCWLYERQTERERVPDKICALFFLSWPTYSIRIVVSLWSSLTEVKLVRQLCFTLSTHRGRRVRSNFFRWFFLNQNKFKVVSFTRVSSFSSINFVSFFLALR